RGPAGPSPYADACPACKLFGCTGTASRLQLADADLAPGYRSVYRDMIGIDRFTGGVHTGSSGGEEAARGGANMRFHALEGTTFTAKVMVTNFELWHLGLLAHVFRDFADGLVAIGFGKSKGFGQVVGKVATATLAYPPSLGGVAFHHLGSLASAAEKVRYDLHDWPVPALPEPLPRQLDQGLALYETYQVADLDALWHAGADAFADFVRHLGDARAPGGSAA
ncbi:MAG TPA: RAMP superfamily CRISPR-associated protein, partial [Thermoanaerobaculia bacterium]